MYTNSMKGTKRLMEEVSKYKYYCECGHSIVIYPFEKRNKKICRWCGKSVYVNKKEEFKDKMRGVLK